MVDDYVPTLFWCRKLKQLAVNDCMSQQHMQRTSSVHQSATGDCDNAVTQIAYGPMLKQPGQYWSYAVLHAPTKCKLQAPVWAPGG